MPVSRPHGDGRRGALDRNGERARVGDDGWSERAARRCGEQDDRRPIEPEPDHLPLARGDDGEAGDLSEEKRSGATSTDMTSSAVATFQTCR